MKSEEINQTAIFEEYPKQMVHCDIISLYFFIHAFIGLNSAEVYDPKTGAFFC